ncbi:MAG: hypothetical protein AB1646_19690 [Thermodesulfobacteriota bacterium]
MARRKQTDMDETTGQALEPDVVELIHSQTEDTALSAAPGTTAGAFVDLNTRFRTRLQEIYQRRATLVDKILDREDATNTMLEQAAAVSDERAEQLELFVTMQGLFRSQAAERDN